MTSARQNKNRNSKWTPTATSTKRNSSGSTPLVTSVNTPSTPSATPVQQASLESYQCLWKSCSAFGGESCSPGNSQELAKEKTDNLEAYSRRLCAILPGIQKSKEETRDNIETSILENLQKTGLPKEERERYIDKLHRVGRFDHETQTQPIIEKFKTHSFKEEIYQALKG